MSRLTGQDSQWLTRHIDPGLLLLGSQKKGNPPQIAHRKVERLREVPMHSGTRKASEPK
jgi:hypothetical protein